MKEKNFENEALNEKALNKVSGGGESYKREFIKVFFKSPKLMTKLVLSSLFGSYHGKTSIDINDWKKGPSVNKEDKS